MFNTKRQWQRLLLGFLFSTAVGIFAYRHRSLSSSGVAGAIATGSVTVGMGGWAWGLSLIYFFASSSFLSHFRSRDKERTAADKFSKGSQRDLLQVMANGGVATALAFAHGLARSQSVQALLQAGYTGTLATANGDTWATELGVLNTGQPRLITTGKPVAPGTSGAITLLGTGASAIGGLSLGIVFWLLEKAGRADALHQSLPLIGLVSGLAGSLADSLMGATLQAMYYCPACKKETERRIHRCGTPTIPLRGIPWFDNDVVNFLATLFGALVGIGVHLGIQSIKKDRQE